MDQKRSATYPNGASSGRATVWILAFTVEGDEGKHTFSYNDLVDADWTVSLKRTP